MFWPHVQDRQNTSALMWAAPAARRLRYHIHAALRSHRTAPSNESAYSTGTSEICSLSQNGYGHNVL
eukprot:6065004-Alexandrium_andersonii.AAC.1